jgi:hypothetical protein
MPSTSIQLILDAAFAEYVNHIGIDTAKHPFADQLRDCHSPEDVLKLLEVKANEFKDYRDGNRKLIDCLKPVVNVIHVFSDVLGEVVSLVSLFGSFFLFTLTLFAIRCYSNQRRRSSLV